MTLKLVTFHGRYNRKMLHLWQIFTFLVIGLLAEVVNCEYGEFGKYSIKKRSFRGIFLNID